mgnify:CR=1 FL=1
MRVMKLNLMTKISLMLKVMKKMMMTPRTRVILVIRVMSTQELRDTVVYIDNTRNNMIQTIQIPKIVKRSTVKKEK